MNYSKHQPIICVLLKIRLLDPKVIFNLSHANICTKIFSSVLQSIKIIGVGGVVTHSTK